MVKGIRAYTISRANNSFCTIKNTINDAFTLIRKGSKKFNRIKQNVIDKAIINNPQFIMIKVRFKDTQDIQTTRTFRFKYIKMRVPR